MFTIDELNYLLGCVDNTPSRSIVEVRNKTHFLNKIVELIEELNESEEE